MSVPKNSSMKSTRRSDPKSISRFLEELSWLLKSNEDLDFKSISRFAVEIEMLDSSFFARKINSKKNINKPIRSLVGVLPSLFVDENLFKSNKDIADFSKEALRIDIPRWDKISRFEIIGHIVCQAERLPPPGIERLTDALEEILSMRVSSRATIAKQRNSGVSWNEIIQDMVSRR